MKRINVIPGTDPAKMLMPMTQLEVAHMQSVIDSCAAVLSQIASLNQHSDSRVQIADGSTIVVPTHTAMAMAAMTQIFGVQYQLIPPGDKADGETAAPPTEVEQPQASDTPSQDEAPPPRRAWNPTVLKGGKS